MRHGDKIKNLGRKKAHRDALMMNLTCQLVEHKRIVTTLAKAKALRVYAEPIITRSKEDSMHNRRIVFSYLQDKEAIKELFGTIGDKVASRPGGYTRIIKLPRRMGDAADMAMIELVDFNEIYTKEGKDAGAKKTRRSRRSGTAVKKTTPAPKAAAETVAEAPAEEVQNAPEAPAQDNTATEENNA
jgi:large subunit ribosomal protein L17